MQHRVNAEHKQTTRGRRECPHRTLLCDRRRCGHVSFCLALRPCFLLAHFVSRDVSLYSPCFVRARAFLYSGSICLHITNPQQHNLVDDYNRYVPWLGLRLHGCALPPWLPLHSRWSRRRAVCQNPCYERITTDSTRLPKRKCRTQYREALLVGVRLCLLPRELAMSRQWTLLLPSYRSSRQIQLY